MGSRELYAKHVTVRVLCHFQGEFVQNSHKINFLKVTFTKVNESGIRGSIATENAASDGNNFDEDLCTNDIGLVITMLQHQIIENSKLAKDLEVYLCKICLVNNVNIIITPCHHATCDSCMEVFINLYINNSNSRKTCPFCNTLMQHVGKMYFP